MLVEIRIRNFKCIRDLTVDLRYPHKKAPNGYKGFSRHGFLECGKAVRVVPTLAIFGPNTSGKSSILQAVAELSSIVKFGIQPRNFIQNRFNTNKGEISTSSLGLTFCLKGSEFQYDIIYDATRIYKEILIINGVTEFEVENATIRRLSTALGLMSDSISNTFNVMCVVKGTGYQTNTLLRFLAREFPGAKETLNQAFSFFLEELLCYSFNEFPLNFSLKLLAHSTEGDTQEQKQSNALKRVLDLLKGLDTGIINLDYHSVPMKDFYLENRINLALFETHEGNQLQQIEIEACHKSDNGNLISLNLFKEESKGIQRLVPLTALLLSAVSSGITLLVDELDSSIHPLLQHFQRPTTFYMS